MPPAVLVIDDDPLHLEVLTALLSTRLGVDGLTAGNGREASGVLDEHPASVSHILTDIFMPGADCFEPLMALVDRGMQVPVITVSGAVEVVVNAASALAMACGLVVLDTLAEPGDHERLVELARAALGGQLQS